MLSRCLFILRLALPVTIAQLGFIAVSFADNIMVGRYSTESLAASSFVVNVFNVVLLGSIGFSYGLTPLIGALFGRGENMSIGKTLRAGLIANLIVALAASSFMAIIYRFIPKMGQPAELLPLIRPFFLIYLASLIPAAIFNTFTQWSYAVRNTSMPMWILLGCFSVNIVGNYALIYGHLGCPELGLLGAGLSTLFARVAGAVIIAGVFFMSRKYAVYREGLLNGRMPKGTLKKVFNTSWPVALQMSFETGAFSACAIFAGWLGTVSLASFQVILVIGTLGFCIYYSIGTAISVLTANEMGRGLSEACRRPAFDGYIVMIAAMLVSCAIFILFCRQLIGLFSDDERVVSMAASLLFPLVLYQLGDATQITFANALRGTSRVRPLMWISFISYIIVGLPSTWILAFPASMGVYGIELSFSISLFLAAALYLYAFLKATKIQSNA